MCVCSRLALGTAALDIQQVTSGALITHSERVFEISAYARIYVKLTQLDPRFHPWEVLLNRLDQMIDAGIRERGESNATRVPMRLQELERHRLHGLRQRIYNQRRRQKRGLFDFVGHIASSLFGVATSRDVQLFNEANKKLATAMQGIVRVQRMVVGKLDLLGENQQRLTNAVNELMDRQEQQAKWMMNFAGMVQKQFRLVTLLDIMSDALSTYDQVQLQAALARMSCESRKVNEVLLPPSFLKQVLASGDNHQLMSIMNYYAYLEVEKITLIAGDNYCLVKAPLFSADDLQHVHIHTFPTCSNSSCAKVFQPPPFVFNSQTEDIFFPETCFGPQPQACLPSVKYDKNTLPCYHGLYLNDPAQLQECPVTLYRQRPPPGPIRTATLNRFVVETTDTLYHYRCPGETPKVGQLAAGAYVITLDPPCVLDASTFILTGVPVHQLNYTLPELQLLELSGLDFSADEYTQFLNALPPTQQHVTLASANEIPAYDRPNLTDDADHLYNRISYYYPVPWYVWLISSVVFLLLMYQLFKYLKKKYKCHRTKTSMPQTERTDNPTLAMEMHEIGSQE